VVWAQRFRVEEGGNQEEMSSWFLNWLRRSHLLAALGALVHLWTSKRAARPRKLAPESDATATQTPWPARISLLAFAVLIGILLYGAFRLFGLLREVSLVEWRQICAGAGVTLLRVLTSVFLGTLWALPAGLAIGLSPRLSRIFQPIVQVVASFPAPLFFPLLVVGMNLAGLSLSLGSVLLMLLGTQWYILFNVIAGTMAIPADLREAARSYRMTLWQRARVLYLPAIFPYLITGWVTAAGGAWNTSIVAEYVTYGEEPIETFGLGSLITMATEKNNLPLLMASALVMAILVVVFNRLVWKRLYQVAEQRYSLSK
jgi:NitT/TauT family transport system permease protein